MYKESVVETVSKVESFPPVMVLDANARTKQKLSEIIPLFVRHGQFELSFSPNTVAKYGESLKMVIRHIGDLPVEDINLAHITQLKQKVLLGGAKEARVASLIFPLKSLLRFCRESLELDVIDYTKVKGPKRVRREVLFLTNEEIAQFVDSIKIYNTWERKTKKECLRMDGLRFRALVEVLLGTGMRISEALSLNRDSIDLENKQAKIVGKGNKERTVFFNDRSLDWIKFYLGERKDDKPFLFVNQRRTRLQKCDVQYTFKRHARGLGINKKITPHILRHSFATNLLFNGCPISHVKELLGHDRLETTCRYYLGLDKTKAKEAHGKFLNY